MCALVKGHPSDEQYFKYTHARTHRAGSIQISSSGSVASSSKKRTLVSVRRVAIVRPFPRPLLARGAIVCFGTARSPFLAAIHQPPIRARTTNRGGSSSSPKYLLLVDSSRSLVKRYSRSSASAHSATLRVSTQVCVRARMCAHTRKASSSRCPRAAGGNHLRKTRRSAFPGTRRCMTSR